MAEPHDDNQDEFGEINDPFVAGVGENALVIVFGELHASFLALLESGFSENQALKFLAFCSIFEGDF